MTNYKCVKRKVDKIWFFDSISSHGYSVRSLAKQIDVNESTMRRMLQEGEASVSVLYTICKFLKTDMETLCGPDESVEWQDFIRKVS